VIPKWPVCGHGGCAAVRASGAEHCWEHLPAPDGLSVALGKLTPGVDIDLRGTRLDGKLLGQILARLRDAADKPLIGTMSCDYARFAGVADFDKATFSGAATFINCAFGDRASFQEAVFDQGADFADSIFDKDAVFTKTAFHGRTSFERCKFDRPLFRDLALSSAEATFEHASFEGGLVLEAVRGFGTLTLTGVHAPGDVQVRANMGEVRCERAKFGGRARLQLTRGDLWLDNTVFAGPATVESWRDPASAAACDPLVRIRSLQGVDAEHLTLSDVDLSHCLISRIYRPEELRLAGHCKFDPTPRGWHLRWHWLPWRWTRREALYEEHQWRGWAPASGPGGIGSSPEARQSDAARLSVLYRQLRRGLEEARDEPGASDLYYGEMEMRRFSTAGWDELWLLTAYWLVSGYGLRASRSMLVLTGLILAAAEGFQRVGFGRFAHHPGYVDCLLYAAGSLLSLDLSGHLPAVLSDWGQVFRMILRVMGPVLLGLGALAVRGRVKRSTG